MPHLKTLIGAPSWRSRAGFRTRTLIRFGLLTGPCADSGPDAASRRPEFGYRTNRSNSGIELWIRFAAALLLVVIACPIHAYDTIDIADAPHTPPVSWSVDDSPLRTQVTQTPVDDDGVQVSRFQLLNSGDPESLRVISPIEPSLLHHDFTAQVRVQATSSGLTVALVVVLPHQQDPRTGKPLRTLIPGDRLTVDDAWQLLKVQVSPKLIEAQMRRLRTELNQRQIVSREATIVGVAILAEATPGETFFDLGSLEYGPVISPPDSVRDLIPDFLPQPGGNPSQADFVPIDLELGSIILDGRPVILRMAPDHHEHLETLLRLGLNAVWVPDFRQVERARELSQARLAVIATPPHPEFEPGDYSRLLHALPPLDQQCPNVSAWYTGTRVPPSELSHLLSWSREVRSADRTLQRPQMADLAGLEGAAAREIDLVGIGRPVIGRDESFGMMRNLLIRRQRSAGQLAFPWTWIQTEPPAAGNAWRLAAGFGPRIVEPEQIQHQVYAVLSAGYKGLGFWKTRTLQIDDPVDRERSLAIELACLEIELLEPFLAGGRIEGYLSLQSGPADRQAEQTKSGGRPLIQTALAGSGTGVVIPTAEAPSGADAAVIRSDRSVLILATAWDDVSQFVPGPMFEREVRMVVAASETASAWEISTTGIRSLPREVTAGGLSLSLRNFDRSAAVLVSSDTQLISQLKQKVHETAARAAAVGSELASLKYVRVMETVEQLRDEHSLPSGIDQLMASARQAVDRAEHERNQQDFAESAQFSADALRFLRQVQQSCWRDALSELSGPTASPHTLSFSTLPDHWRLVHYLDRQSHRISDNLLPSGSFDNLQSIRDDGWQSSVPEDSKLSATADVIRDPSSGQILRLVAWKSDASRSAMINEMTPVVVTSPGVPVSAGDVMLVSGRVRRGRSVSATSGRPLLVFDSELGPECGMRLSLDSEWETFEMIRPIATAGEFRVSLSLSGQAEVQADQLQIRCLPAAAGGPGIPEDGEENPAQFPDTSGVQ